jgi:hypothetical protein
VPDKNGIIWDDPRPPAQSPPAQSPPAQSPPVQTAPAARPIPAPAATAPSTSAGTLDNAGIIWNGPAKPAASRDSIPATPRRSMAAAPSAAGPCHEFQTTIVIDGQKQPAHGTVCQQPDGTWRVVDK